MVPFVTFLLIPLLLLHHSRGAPSGFNLLPPEGLTLVQDNFDQDGQSCTKEDVFHAAYTSFALPTNSSEFSLVTQLGDVGHEDRHGVVLVFEDVTFSINPVAGELRLNFTSGRSLNYEVPAVLAAEEFQQFVALVRRKDGALRVCLGDTQVFAKEKIKGNKVQGLPSDINWEFLNDDSTLKLPQISLSIGDPQGKGTLDAHISFLLLIEEALDCPDVALVAENILMEDSIVGAPGMNQLPVVQRIWHSPETVFVGQGVTVEAAALDYDMDTVRIRMTFFGVPQRPCQSATCGDEIRESIGFFGEGEVHSFVEYKRAGRYIVRVEVTDMKGHIITEDHEILVRKVGDVNASAECCRTTGMVIALQEGRPIHAANYRDPSVFAHAQRMGWDAEYWTTEDLEAERLFDFGSLAPDPSGPLVKTSCHDVMTAGSGSARTLSHQNPGKVLGHNKRILMIPQGLKWGEWDNLTIAKPECETHFTNWAARSPYQSTKRGVPCSYTCTRDGLETMIREAGSYDRLNEAVIEATYGRASLSWEVEFTEVIYLAHDSPHKSTFAFHDRPVRSYLSDKGIDMEQEYFMGMVLSPWPHHNNWGTLAWASGSNSMPLIFVLQCNPRMYYLIHETGHNFGLPHSVLYKLENATNVPSDPLGPGVIEDGYTDKLDIMACCKGNFNLHSRILAGWVAGNERAHLPVSSVREPYTHKFIIWPFDRSASEGNLMAVTMRLTADKMLVFGYRSVPFWQDVKVSRYPLDSRDGPLANEDMRHNIRGLSVGYSNRYEKRGKQVWSLRGLLDFNVLFGEWPHTVPRKEGAIPGEPGGDSFAQLKEGYPWFHFENGEETGIMALVERIAGCNGNAKVPVYSYSVHGFYGWRGERPFQETVEKHDYTGFEQLECLHLMLRAGVQRKDVPGAMEMKIRFADADAVGNIHLGRKCGFDLQSRLKALFPAGLKPESIVWKDNMNRTFAMDTDTAILPPLADFMESSVKGSQKCTKDCPTAYTVKAAASDGSHSRADITIKEASLDRYAIDVRYTRYTVDSIAQRMETTVARVVPAASHNTDMPGHPSGISVVAGERRLNLPAVKRKLQDLPSATCSNQWTISMLVQMEADIYVGKYILFSVGSAPHSVSSSVPLVEIHHPHRTDYRLVVQWQHDKQYVDVSGHFLERATTTVHLLFVYDNDRLGVWVDGKGGWLVPDVWCIPSRQKIAYCDHDRKGMGLNWSPEDALWIGDEDRGLDATLMHMKMYNYAIPQAEWEKERDCTDLGSCASRFMVQEPKAAPSPPLPVQPIVSRPATTYYWFVGDGEFGACSVECGGGVQHRSVACVTNSDRGRVYVDPQLCPQEQKPDQERRCNVGVCGHNELRWKSRWPEAYCVEDACSSVDSDEAMLCFDAFGFAAPLQSCSIDYASQYQNALHSFRAENRVNPDCQPMECTNRYFWSVTPWSSCDKLCGGGTSTRRAVCMGSDEQAEVDASLCNTADRGPITGHEMLQTCNDFPCDVHVWKVGGWEACHGEDKGYSLRTVNCIDGNGTVVANGMCSAPIPSEEEACRVDENAAVCRPINSPQNYVDCSGHGNCGWWGCDCLEGFHGAYCETPPSCVGVLDKHAACCESGLVDGDGSCCESIDAVLDANGKCCPSGKVDVCGFCDGSATAVDIMGRCCLDSTLGQNGLCCEGGYIDECGVCNGNSMTCAIQMNLHFWVEGNRKRATSLSTAEEAVLHAALALGLSNRLALEPGSFRMGPVLQGEDSPEQSFKILVKISPQEVMSNVTVAFTLSAVLSKLHAFSITSTPPGVGLITGSRSLAAESIHTADWLPEDWVIRLTDINGMARLGICGNGVCEIGEQVVHADSTEGFAAGSSDAGCREDCKIPLHMCAQSAPEDGNGQPKQCGGHGTCLIASGACQCFAGYIGDLCDACAAGYTMVNGACQKHYVHGAWLPDGPSTFDIEAGLDGQSEERAGGRSSSAGALPFKMLLAVAACILTAIVLLVCCFLMACARARQRRTTINALSDPTPEPSKTASQSWRRHNQTLNRVRISTAPDSPWPEQTKGSLGPRTLHRLQTLCLGRRDHQSGWLARQPSTQKPGAGELFNVALGTRGVADANFTLPGQTGA